MRIRIFMVFANALIPGWVKLVISMLDNVVIDECSHALDHHALTEMNAYPILPLMKLELACVMWVG